MGFQHFKQAHSQWAELQQILNSDKPVVIDGESLTVAGVVAVALYGKHAAVTDNPAVLDLVQRSVDFLDSQLQNGHTVYGVTTGFGGSADTRTKKVEILQVALLQHLNVGILLPSDKGLHSDTPVQPEGLQSHALPVPLVRGMMIVRCNSLIRGHSGVRLTVIRKILSLLEKEMTPVVPLRGSISASGDLSTLSYIAGVLEGNPDVFVRIGNEANSTYLPADKALQLAGIQPITLQAKEGLGIMNGTAPSCAAGSIAIYQAQHLALLTQLLTAVGTEALLGTGHNYHPFISATRPHPGQTEVAANISLLLSGSKLAPNKDPETIGLAQDRYALRTAPQWIGPQLEDLDLAHRQVQAEVNSTTDNPLIDVETSAIHHGGNFQAACITSAMEKTMTSLQMLGKLLFAQSSELVHHKFNKGLPPNLASDDPSLSFTAKGFDVNMAAYMSELAYIAHPVSSHVQSAEMHNQAVNSLALITARYALIAVDLVSLMSGTYIYLLCQALDLRCLHLEFVKVAKPAIYQLLKTQFGNFVADKLFDDFAEQSWKSLLDKWESLSHLDLDDRALEAAKDSLGNLLHSLIHDHNVKDGSIVPGFLLAIEQYQKNAGITLSTLYSRTRETFYEHQTTAEYLSPASAKLYTFVRKDLKVPFHRGLADHPTVSGGIDGNRGPGKILGTLASDIYLAIRSGRLNRVVVGAFTDE